MLNNNFEMSWFNFMIPGHSSWEIIQLGVRNSIFYSKMFNSDSQTWKMRKNEVSKIYFSTCFDFLDIARTEPHRFTRHLVGMLRMSLPHLPKQLRDQNNSQKQWKHCFVLLILLVFTSFNTKRYRRRKKKFPPLRLLAVFSWKLRSLDMPSCL